MNEKLTVNHILSKFDHFHKTPSGSVIIHPGLSGNLIEITEEFAKALKKDLNMQMLMASNGIDELSPTAKFLIMLLETSY